MKKTIITICIFLCTVYCSFGKSNNNIKVDTVPQTITDTAFLRVLGKAVRGDSAAMYIIGKCYLLGSHVKRDVEKAFEWNEKAVIDNYPQAWVEKGLYYKYGTGRPIDYSMAYQGFSGAAVRNNASGMYYKGYMLFKGLGVQQNYTAAVQEFKKGANMNNAASMYFLGLCFRNGFGITINIDSARHWLRKSADLNYHLSMDELMAETPEFCPNEPKNAERIMDVINNADKVGFDITHYTNVVNNVNVNQFKGTYAGYIVKYDYSQTKITETNALYVELSHIDSLARILWYEEKVRKVLHLTAKLKNNHFVFEKYSYLRPEHYHEVNPFINTFKTADLRLEYAGTDTLLIGNINLYVSSLLEPQQKMTIVLLKDAISNTGNGKVASSNSSLLLENTTIEQPVLLIDEIPKKITSLIAYPNPFDGLINIEFSLRQASEARVKLTAVDGRVYFTSPLRSFLAGENITTIETSVPSGIYFITLDTGGETKKFKMIKH